MSGLLSRLFNIRPQEAAKVFLLVSMFFLFITGTAWAETIIESSYYYLVGVKQLSLVFTLHAIFALVATAVYTAFVDQTSNQKLLVAVCGVAMLAIGLGLLLLEINQILAYTILYVLVRAVRTSFIIHWWNYASDFYDVRASKRIVPVINSSSRVAIIVAGLTIPLLNHFFSAVEIILLWVLTLALIAVLSWVMNRVVPLAAETETERLPQAKKEKISYLRNIRQGFQYVSSSNYLRWIALSTFLMVIIFALLNYQGGLIFKNNFGSREEITNFIGYLNGLTSLVMLPVQLFFFSRLVARIGVGNANVIFPLGTFLVSGAVLFAPISLSSGALAHFDRNTFRYSTQEASNNLLYNAVPARVKGRARSFIDGLVLPVALLVSSALLEFGKLLPASWFLPLLLGIPALGFLLCSLVIRRLYARAMISLLEQEDYVSLSLSAESIELAADPDAKNILLKKLVDSHDEAVILLTAKIMAETIGAVALPILELKAKESSASLRAGIIDVLADADVQPKFLKRLCNSFLRDPDGGVRLSAFIGLQKATDTGSQEFMDQAARLLQDANYELRSRALACLLNSGQPMYMQPAEAVLDQLLHSQDIRARVCALDTLGRTGEERFVPTIIGHLDEPAEEVRMQALAALEMRSTADLPEATIKAILWAARRLLKDPLERVRMVSLSILAKTCVPDSYAIIAKGLADPSRQVREASADILAGIGEAVVPSLLRLLDDRETNLHRQSRIKEILGRINVRQYGDLLEEQIQVELQAIYTRIGHLAAIQGLPALPGVLVLSNFMSELNRYGMDEIFSLLSARYGEEPVQTIIQSLAAESSRTRANASEALESMAGPALAKLVMPLFDSNFLASETVMRIGLKTWDIKEVDAPALMPQLVTDPQNEWVRAFAIYAMGEIFSASQLSEIPKNNASPTGEAQLISRSQLQELLSVALQDPSLEVRQAALAAARMSGQPTPVGDFMKDRLSAIERIIFLKQVPLFQSMPAEQLKVLANICEEQFVPQGTTIFEEGDPSGVVYVVVNGRVGIERQGERDSVRLATLEARASLGEITLFRNSPRTASALAIEDTLLLSLRAEPFMALVRQHPDMSIELINVLSTRLIEVNDQLTNLKSRTTRAEAS